MTERGRREYAEALRARYAAADKRARGRMLDEYCRVTGCHRKAAIRRLRAGLPGGRRRGARVRKRYDAPQTPYQRLLAAGVLAPAQRQALAAQLVNLDPIALARDIEQTLDLLWKLADTARTRRELARG